LQYPTVQLYELGHRRGRRRNERIAERRRWNGNRKKKGGLRRGGGEGIPWNRERRWRGREGRDRLKDMDGDRKNRQMMMTKRRRGS
jgi:hypothetical protein